MTRCIVRVRTKSESCPERPTRVLVFSDGQEAPACDECALYVSAMGASMGAAVRVEPPLTVLRTVHAEPR